MEWKRASTGWPDYLEWKESPTGEVEIRFVEEKSGNDYLRANQLHLLGVLERAGLPVFIRKIETDSMMTLSNYVNEDRSYSKNTLYQYRAHLNQLTRIVHDMESTDPKYLEVVLKIKRLEDILKINHEDKEYWSYANVQKRAEEALLKYKSEKGIPQPAPRNLTNFRDLSPELKAQWRKMVIKLSVLYPREQAIQGACDALNVEIPSEEEAKNENAE